jgi:tetratricopeptide (TPR) repeat protein
LSLRRNSADPQRREQALRDLQIAVQLDPRNVSARLQRAQVRSESAEYEAAVQDLRVALQVAPGNKQVHFQLRVVLTRLQRRDQARHHLEVWKLLHRLTESVANASAPDLAERTEILLRLKELNPHDWGRRIELVQLLLHRELFAQAEGEIDTLREQGAPERTVQGLLEQSQQAQQRAREESDEDPQR